MKKTTKIAILFLVGTIITVIFFPTKKAPETIFLNDTQKNTQDNIIQIAVTYEKLASNVMTWPHPVSAEKIIALVNLTEVEINQYCLDNQIKKQFNFIPTPVIHKGGTQRGENPPGLDEMIQLNEADINLIVGHDYSLANRYSFEYAKDNDMLLFSPTGLAIGQAGITDNLFQLKPNYYETRASDKVFAQMIKELDYEAFVTINIGK